MKQAFDRLHSMLLCVGLLKVRYKVPKVKQKDQELKGILAVNAPEKVKIVTYSLKDGIQEKVFKIFCGYLVEAVRFFHQIESKHVNLCDDLCESLESSQYAESGYGSAESGFDSDGNTQLMDSEAKKNLMDQTALAESHIVASNANLNNGDESNSNLESEMVSEESEVGQN